MGLLDNQNESTYYAGSGLGNYQFTSLQTVIDQFMLAYVGEGKIITKVKRPAGLAILASLGNCLAPL